MSEKRFVQCEIEYGFANTTNIKKVDGIYDMQEEKTYRIEQIVVLLNEQQELIEELHISDHMGWERAEHFEKELKQKKIYIKRLEYKVQKFKEENEQLRKQCFELEKDYLLETSDISDKIYLDDEIRELKKKYGVTDE